VTRRLTWLVLVALAWGVAFLTTSADAEIAPATITRQGVELFERRIRPVLVRQCYPCHSAAAQKTDGGISLDRPDDLRRSRETGALVVAGDPAKSGLIQFLRRGHRDGVAMPGKGAPPRSVVVDFEAWVQMGAPDPRAVAGQSTPRPDLSGKHWAFQPIRNPPPPSTTTTDTRDPIDAFVAAALAERGQKIGAPADAGRLLRRLSFDLVGLPPTPAEVEAFVSDPSTSALARVVDRLLQSPEFGERWGGAWLQTVRYADVGAAELSPVRENAWRYRDYVIAAFNSDKPYDDFVREQLAGDLLSTNIDAPPPDQLVATGFLVVGSRLVQEQRRARLNWEVADEQIDLTMRTFLGLSVACARCHDHKSDPITTTDYYALAGIFGSTTSLTSPVEEGRRNPTRWLERSLATQEQLAELSEYETRLEELKQQFNEAREMKLAFPGEVNSAALSGVIVDNLAAEVHGAWKESSYSTNFVDRNYLHDGNADKGRKSVRYVPELPAEGVYDVLVSYTPRDNRATNVPVTITSVDGVKTVALNQTRAPTVDKVFASVGHYKFVPGKPAAVVISNEGTRGFVVADAVRFVPVEKEGAGAQVAASETETPEKALLNFHQVERELMDFRGKKPVLPAALAVQEGKIQDSRVRPGGDPDKQGAKVPRGFLSALGTPDSTLYVITDESSGRLELANWLVNPDNPLTARVAVNRIWALLMGEALVESQDDFGVLGARPSDPDLLDHLAWRFMNQGWSVKKLIRALVLSRTYQAASPGRAIAPDLLRDASLALSRELDRTSGGPWMPTNNVSLDGLQAARRVQTSSTRRSVYMPVIRDRVPDSVAAFQPGASAQPKNLPAGRRAVPPAQRFLRDRASAWADALIEAIPNDDAKRISAAYREAFGRPPRAEETTEALRQVQTAKVAAKDAADPVATAWANLCESLLTSEEFRTR
jgi:hypothetical protein